LSCALLPTTGAIAARIFFAWKSHPRGNSNSLPYWRVVVVIVESSALYAVAVLATLISFVSGTNGQYPAVDAIVPLVVSLVLSLASIREFFLLETLIRVRSGHCILSHCDPNPPSYRFYRDKWDSYLLTRTYFCRDAIA
jgi:hypothetical protein